jgi:hypothetical protein
MSNELLIGLGGLVLGVLSYFAGVHRTEKRLRSDDRALRIRRVFDRYMGFRSSNYTGGYDGLQKAGAATLASHEEILELVQLIVAHGEKHPLGSNYDQAFAGVDLKAFFEYAASNRVNFLRTPIEEVIAKFGAKP